MFAFATGNGAKLGAKISKGTVVEEVFAIVVVVVCEETSCC